MRPHAPTDHVASIQVAVRQWVRRSIPIRVPGPASNSSTIRLADLATQLSSTRPDNSIRSPSGPYQVSRGRVGSPTTSERTRSAIAAGTGPG